MSDQRNLSVVYRISELLYKHAIGKLTDTEFEELAKWVASDPSNRDLYNEVRNEYNFRPGLSSFYEAETGEALKSVTDQIFPSRSKSFFLGFKRWQYAAIFLGLIVVSGGLAVYFLRYNEKPALVTIAHPRPAKTDLPPGGNKALLTLGDGSTIILDSSRNGMVSQQGSAKVLKVNDGQLAYRSTTTVPTSPVYNTLSTPHGGQYQLVLPDGTHIWLNAGSTLRYPTTFDGKERGVELTGEAYFEVAKKADMPFKVKANDVEIDVLGTHFNVMAYAEENETRATLLTGSIKISQGSVNAVLKPGDQSQINSQGKFRVINKVNTDNEVSWKNGNFFFDQADIPAVMRQLSRWYDVNVVFEGTPQVHRFSGKIQRDLQLSQVLDILKSNQVNCKLEGKKLIVLP